MKFVDSYYDKGSRISIVGMLHKGHIFKCHAYIHPDDVDKASEFAGCSYAETRAYIKALKYERKLLKDEAETCRKFIKSCECYKNWDKESPTAKAAYRQLNRRIKRVNDITDKINDAMKELSQAIWQRDITAEAFEKNKQKRLNSKSEN